MPAPRSLLLSPLRYPGGKSWLVPQVRRWLLPRRPALLIEPFAGGGSVCLAAVAEGLTGRGLMLELDEDIARFWAVILGRRAVVLAKRVIEFELTGERVRAELARSGGDDVDRAFRLLLRNRTSRGGLLTASSGLLRAGENGVGIGSRWYPETLAKRIITASALRERIAVEHGDGLEALTRYGESSDVAYFIDPPYVGATPASPGARLYRHVELDHAQLFTLVGGLTSEALLTYQDHPRVRAWAAEYQMEARRVTMRTTHHERATELLIGRDLSWLTGPGARTRRARQPDSVSCRDRLLEPAAMTAADDSFAGALVGLDEAAGQLSASRRTVERLIVDGELERVRRGGRAYVTFDSLAALKRRRDGRSAQRDAAGAGIAALTASVEALADAVRRDRSELLTALREREELRVELARVTAELDAERAGRAR